MESKVFVRGIDVSERLYASVFALYVLARYISSYAVCLTNLIGDNEMYVEPFIKVILFFAMLLCVYRFAGRLKFRVVIFTVIAIVVIVLNCILFPKTIFPFLRVARSFILNAWPIIIIVLNIEKFEYLKNALIKISKFIGWISLITILLAPAGIFDSKWNAEYFNLGYSCFLPTLMLVVDAMEQRKVIGWFLTAVMLIFLVLYGNRTPLLGIALFIMYYVVSYLKINHKKTELAMLLFLGVSFILGISLTYQQILTFLYERLSLSGIYSRTLMLASLTYSGNNDPRVSIMNRAFEEIKKDPFLVRGISSDVLALGVYPHNIFIEILFQFGIVIGSILILVVIRCIIKTLRMDIRNDYEIVCTVLMFSSVVQLMFSLSFWNSTYFWLWFLLVSISVRKHKYTQSELKGKCQNGYYSVLSSSVS